jgi:hypothetical protein
MSKSDNCLLGNSRPETLPGQSTRLQRTGCLITWQLESRVVTYLSYSLITCFVVLFFVRILPYCRSFPYSDDWFYLPAFTLDSAGKIMAWLFEQHVDHRIPIQKLLHVSLLKLSGFDFRVLVAVNYLIAAALASLAVAAARAYRGFSCIGDLFIPAVVLSVGSGMSQWGFEFTFLSSIFFATAFLYLVVSAERKMQTLRLDFAIIALILCALCGLQGMVVSSTLTALLAGFFSYEWKALAHRHTPCTYVAVGLSLVVNGLLWLFWKPSGASTVSHFSMVPALHYIFGLVDSSLIVYAFQDPWPKFVPLALLLLCGFCFSGIAILGARGRSIANLALFGVLLATSVVMMAIALGRSRYQAWSPGLEMHYGYLTILGPIAAWISISARINRVARSVPGLLIVTLFACAFQANWKWRTAADAQWKGQNQIVRADLSSGLDPETVAAKDIALFFFVDTADVRAAVTKGIVILRRERGTVYSPRSGP